MKGKALQHKCEWDVVHHNVLHHNAVRTYDTNPARYRTVQLNKIGYEHKDPRTCCKYKAKQRDTNILQLNTDDCKTVQRSIACIKLYFCVLFVLCLYWYQDRDLQRIDFVLFCIVVFGCVLRSSVP